MATIAEKNFNYLYKVHQKLMDYLVTDTEVFKFSKARVLIKRYGHYGSVLQIDLPTKVLPKIDFMEDEGDKIEISIHANKESMKVLFQGGYGFKPQIVDDIEMDPEEITVDDFWTDLKNVLDQLLSTDDVDNEDELCYTLEDVGDWTENLICSCGNWTDAEI